MKNIANRNDGRRKLRLLRETLLTMATGGLPRPKSAEDSQCKTCSQQCSADP